MNGESLYGIILVTQGHFEDEKKNQRLKFRKYYFVMIRVNLEYQNVNFKVKWPT